MNGSNYQFKVGVFVSLGLVFILASILILGGSRSFFTNYQVYQTRLEQVQGLNKGSLVSVSGLNVGNIKEMHLDEGPAVVVSFTVSAREARRLTKSSTVEVRTSGALGDKFLYISPGLSGEEALPEGSWVPALEGKDLLDALTAKGGEATKILMVIDELLKFTRSLNGNGRTDRILMQVAETSENLRVLSQDLRAMTQNLKTDTPQHIREAAQRLNSILEKLDRGEGSLGALINDSSLHEQLKSLLGSSQRQKSLKKMLESSIDSGAEP